MAAKFKAVLVDVDGTTVLSEERNRNVIETLAEKHGGRIDKADWNTLSGQPEKNIWEWLKERYSNLAIAQDDFVRECRAGYLTSQFNVAARPGMKESFDYYRERGLRIVAVTNSPRDIAEHSLRATGMWDELEFMLSADEVLAAGKSPKPAPDPYLMAAKMLGVEPEECLVYEDSGTGVRSGLAAGMTVVQVLDYGLPLEKKADYFSHNREQLIALGRYLANEPKP
jgi:beta-phosphoglucomutase-like phosphatase (HAD superfamily)